eukprot:CAMPEP_0178909930 /NCGR_PEP_ID=MMETSP0786-20121207/8809_1 /TAXON_ID=186022 /ORGANISM="Thalassionema frauenfeldii, Strain CCMP 1798" /LENGTH=174 /DNA_ID=CAMNT_0020582113 /DNA_START=30 /DNA_END=551 /DNA_ORIENTATION=-
MRCLTLQRQLLEVKEKRKTSNKRYEDMKEHYEHRLSCTSKRLRRILFGRTMVPTYFRAVKSQYDILCRNDMPVDYVLRMYAELIKYVRHQKVIDLYINVLEQHNHEFCKYLHTKKMSLVIGLGKQEEKLETVDEELVEIVANKIARCYKEKDNTTCGGYERHGSVSSLESLLVH